MALNFKIVYCVMTHNSDREVFRAEYENVAREWITDKMDEWENNISKPLEYYIRKIWTNVI